MFGTSLPVRGRRSTSGHCGEVPYIAVEQGLRLRWTGDETVSPRLPRQQGNITTFCSPADGSRSFFYDPLSRYSPTINLNMSTRDASDPGDATDNVRRPAENGKVSYKRRRIAMACTSCRTRKSRVRTETRYSWLRPPTDGSVQWRQTLV